MRVDVINGLLGAGKTTFLLNLLNQKSPDEKIAVLVNEFGEIGIDGDLLGGQGADVVELPNGCICCTLNADLKNQIRVIAETYQPDLLYIEPTGVATIKNLMGILKSLSLEKYIDELRTFVILDAGTFWEIFGQNRGFVETQIEMGDIIVINKCDKVDAGELNKITGRIKQVNSSAQIVCTSFGLGWAKQTSPGKAQHSANEDFDGIKEPEAPLKQFQQFSTSSGGTFDLEKLRRLFGMLKDNRFGRVDRAKGIFCTAGGWVRVDLASHEVSEFVLGRDFATSKVIVIGTMLQKDAIRNEFNKCLG